MALPNFTDKGDLPEGIWSASLLEVLDRFDSFGDNKRRSASNTLKTICNLAVATGQLQSILIFGNYVTSKPNPNDVDVILIMTDEFSMSQCPADSRLLFDHQAADAMLSASVFWIRPSLLIMDTLDNFRQRWQLTREGYR